jgi:anti-sigma factor RsiW
MRLARRGHPRSWRAKHLARPTTASSRVGRSRCFLALLGHLLDVASTDQDRLKAWFTGKLDFAPPVVNLTKGGCKLAGVRLDILANRRAAAIVYKHQDCLINVFTWPAADHAIDLDTQSLLGFRLRGWTKSGLNYLIVSKLSQSDMENFEDQLRERTE